jgi:hypothetical protein
MNSRPKGVHTILSQPFQAKDEDDLDDHRKLYLEREYRQVIKSGNQWLKRLASGVES